MGPQAVDSIIGLQANKLTPSEIFKGRAEIGQKQLKPKRLRHPTNYKLCMCIVRVYITLTSTKVKTHTTQLVA